MGNSRMNLHGFLAKLIRDGLVLGIPIAFAAGRALRRAWRGPESQLRTVLIPTEDPIFDRAEIFLRKD